MAKRNTTNDLGQCMRWLTVLAISSGCAEAPRLADDPWSGDGSNETKDADRDEESAAAPATSEDVSVEEHEPGQRTPHEAEVEEDEDNHAIDGETDQAPDDSGARMSDDAGLEPDSGVRESDDAGREPDTMAAPGEDAAAPEDACDPNPCQHGTCSIDAGPYVCACADGYSRPECQDKTCGSVAIRSRADVENNQECAEIRGDLSISSTGLTEITAEDFPLLTKITGNLTIIGAHAPNAPPLESVTLPNLRTVEGAVVVIGFTVVETTSGGPVKELHLPALERIGAHDALGLGVYLASLRVLDLPVLAAIEGSVVLDTLVDLCTVNVENVEEVGGDVAVRNIPRVLPAQLAPLRSAAAGTVSEQLLGCCVEGSDVGTFCDDFTEDARAMYCMGC